MNRVPLLLCTIYGTLVLQSNLFSAPLDMSFPIWLPGLALVACVLLAESTTTIVCAALLGLAIDCLDQNQLGIHTVLATLISTIMVTLNRHHHVRGFMSIMLTIFVSQFFWRAGSTQIHGYLDRRTFDIVTGVMAPAIEAAATALVGGTLVLISSLPPKIRQPSTSKPVSLTNRWTMLTGE